MYKCPKCGSEEEFITWDKYVYHYNNEGRLLFNYVANLNNPTLECLDCGYEGDPEEFTIEDDKDVQMS